MGPLDGIRVLDLCRTVPGAYCSMLLGDMGADVVLVEQPGRARDWRAVPESEDPERARAFNPLGRNKRSVAIDLKQVEGRALLRAFSARADVLIEGFRPGVADRLGASYPALSADNPRLVHASLSGYGQTGPYARYAGHDINYAALAGAIGMIGRPGSRPAIPMNFVADLAGGGLLAAYGIVLALFARERTGKGQSIDVGMLDGAAALLVRLAGTFFESGIVPRPGEHRINGGSPHYDVYECADGGHLAVGPLEEGFRRNLCIALGIEVGADVDLRAALTERLRQKTRDEWFALLGPLDTCVTPVLRLDEVFRDPHLRARGMLVEVDDPAQGKVPQVGIAPLLSATPGSIRQLTPRLGQHTRELLAELGRSEEEIKSLSEHGVVTLGE
jgi:alpha-methylacyl-CoA racemase